MIIVPIQLIIISNNQTQSNIMARLQKGLDDYFRIPILLKPVGQTTPQSVNKIYSAFSKQTRCLILDDRYESPKTLTAKILQKRQPNVPQTFKFMISQFFNEWCEFQVIYRCRFCVGVFNCQNGNLAQQWKKISKQCIDENKKLVGLIILSVENCNVEGIKQPLIIIPQKLQYNDYFQFLEPWFFSILPLMQEYFCYLISQLQKEDNGFIVFNKNQEKPQPRTLKKKKKGRCLKICGDFCLVLHLVKQAYGFYIEAEQLLKKMDDYLWSLGCNQGKLACFITDFALNGVNKQQALQQARIQCLTLAKKIKVPQLQTENYFKILKIYTKISQKFDQMARDFIVYLFNNYSSTQKFSIFTQLAMLYKQAGMMRKHNYMLYLSARIAIDIKPNLVGIILNEILKSGHLKQWPLVNANVIKLLIDNTTDSKQGRLHLGLLQNCCCVLTERDVAVTLQSLYQRNFRQVLLENTQIFDIVGVSCIESAIRPKANMIAQESPQKPTTGFFMSWRRKQIIYKFQQNQQAHFELKIRNNITFTLRCSICLHFSKNQKTQLHSYFLQPKLNKLNIIAKFPNVIELLNLQKIQIKIFNFTYIKTTNQFPGIKLQIYEEYPVFEIKIPEVFHNEQSSLFQFPLRLTRTKPYIKLAKVSLTISVYYHLEVGFQQTIYQIQNIQQQKYVIVLSDYPYNKHHDLTKKLIKLLPLKVNKKHIKKIQCKVQAISTQNSKYQISTQANSAFMFQRSIWCDLLSITTPNQVKFQQKSQKIIQDQFIVKIAVNKKKDDLTPYKIMENNNSYILSQNTSVIVQKILKKMNKDIENSNKPLQICFEWCNSTREKQRGTIIYQIPPHQIMFLSQKKIKFKIDCWNNEQKQQLKSPAEIILSYTIISKQNQPQLSHCLVVQPYNLPSIKKYVMSGKIKIKQKQNQKQINNQVKIKFFYQYAERYLIGIKFQDGQIYWFPCVFLVNQ